MQSSVFLVAMLAALTAAASIPQPDNDTPAPKQKRGLLGSYYAPSAAVVAHAPVYHAPVVAHAPAVYHAPVVAHAPVYHAPATSYSSISVTHNVPKLAIAHAPVYHAPAPLYHAPAPVYHAPVVAHAPLISHAAAYYH